MPSRDSDARSQLDRSIMRRIGRAMGAMQLPPDEGPVPDALAALLARLREAEQERKPMLAPKAA